MNGREGLKPERERELEGENLERAYQEAMKICQEHSIIPGHFFLYDPVILRKDAEAVAKIKEKRKKEPYETREFRKLTAVLETVFFLEAELAEWFGPNAFTIKTSEYDDFINGVDVIIEFYNEDGTSCLTLALDITLASNTGDLRRKLRRAREEIDDAKLARIKYFSSEHSGIRGELKDIPRGVVGIDFKAAVELINLWMNKDSQALASHPIQFQILKQLEIQMEGFENYARKRGDERIALIYSRLLKIIERVIKSKTSRVSVPTLATRIVQEFFTTEE